MVKQLFSPLQLLLIFLCCSTAFSQPPAQAPAAPPPAQAPVALPPPVVQSMAPGPASSGPPNITAILEKAGHFTTFIRLLRSTKMDSDIYTQLNTSSQGLTVFAPDDYAFGNLSAGALNAYNDDQKSQLVKFHLISSYFSLPEFQTVSNPVSTEAGTKVEYPLNVTISGSQVNLTSGFVNTTVSNTVYTNGHLAVYAVDQVLLPRRFFVTPSPAPAPAPSKPVKESPSTPVSTADASVQASGAMPVIHHALSAVTFLSSFIAALTFCI
ncbi:fasciclin-like arabinogalactan protein 12 [Diospyros lotus]|uniref:fasciclin-like arabinogalactan protein 12 n=1 Tax=Diospyros lotus TaxID=55363 RepID=UPI00225824B2|nr:fasciclin-like arabinogalactan protein 12 [Diospyros lotus]XP_052175370.1 fasciclin-like arabinogalactan protein 12 [Diospyros lotus]